MTREDPARFDLPNGQHRDGSTRNGSLHVVHEVHCPGCEAPSLGLPHTKAKAEAELRRDGWTKRGGLWRCPPCSKRIA